MTRAERNKLKFALMVGYLLAWYLAAQEWSGLNTEVGELVASFPFLLLVVLLITDYDHDKESEGSI